MDVKTINKIIGIFSILELPKVEKVKNWLRDNYDSYFTPSVHLSYIVNTLPEYNLSAFIKEFEEILYKIGPIHLKIGTLHTEDNFISLKVNSSDSIDLHHKLLKLVNKYRDGYVREKDLFRYENGKYSKKDFNTIRKYGFKYVLNEYNPHITIGTVPKGDLEKVLDKLRVELKEVVDKEFIINTITAYYHISSEDHAKTKVIWSKTYELN